MKDINVRISTKVGVIISAFVLIGVVVAVGFAYKEMGTLRKDLYAVRDDYYGTGEEADPYQDKKVDVKVLSQQVKKLRVANSNYGYIDSDTEFSERNVRVVEVELTNNKDVIFSYYGNFAYINADGIVKRTIQVHNDDQMSEWAKDGGTLELASGAKAKIFLHFIDEGSDITQLIDVDKDEFGATEYYFVEE